MNDPVLKPRLLHVAAVGLCRHRSREGFGCKMLGTGTCERRGSKEDWVEAELQCRPGKALANLAEDSRATTAQQVVPYGGRGCALHPPSCSERRHSFPQEGVALDSGHFTLQRKGLLSVLLTAGKQVPPYRGVWVEPLGVYHR